MERLGRSARGNAAPLVYTLHNRVVFGQVAPDATYFTGIAIPNPSDSDANATIDLFASDGRPVVSTTEVVPARARGSKLFTEYFEALTGQTISGGYIKVTSDRGLASFALFGTRNLTALSAVPAQPVQ